MRSLGDIAKIRTFSRLEKMAGKLTLLVISSIAEQKSIKKMLENDIRCVFKLFLQ